MNDNLRKKYSTHSSNEMSKNARQNSAHNSKIQNKRDNVSINFSKLAQNMPSLKLKI